MGIGERWGRRKHAAELAAVGIGAERWGLVCDASGLARMLNCALP